MNTFFLVYRGIQFHALFKRGLSHWILIIVPHLML